MLVWIIHNVAHMLGEVVTGLDAWKLALMFGPGVAVGDLLGKSVHRTAVVALNIISKIFHSLTCRYKG